MVTIDKAFSTENRSVYEYFQRPAIGFYIPLYQREYSWDADNVDQLLEDLSSGIEQLTSDKERDNSEIRFLGTIITVTEVDKARIQPQDVRALPTAIEKVIDGQQRLSTIALLACLLHRHMVGSCDSLVKAAKQLRSEEGEALQKEITAIGDFWKDRLDDLYSVDLKRGNPTRKPKIIRGKQDKWILEEQENDSYISSVASVLFEYIEFAKAGGRALRLQGPGLVKSNLRQMDSWIRNQVMRAHVESEPEFPRASVILSGITEDQLWQYERANLASLVRNYTRDSKEGSLEFLMNSFTQLLAVCHYLLDRCCFTIIQPISDDWAFDMFQSLNATGTPLTAIETFKPLVVNTVEQSGKTFKGSDIERYYSRVERPFEGVKNTAQKNKLTNDLLTSFAIAVNGHKLPSHFSSQRKWMEQVYQGLSADDQSKYIKHFGDYASYFYDIWLNYDGHDRAVIPGVGATGDGLLGSTLLLFLKKSNHKMSNTVLANLHAQSSSGDYREYLSGIKLLAAFYTQWRAVRSNSGLDDVYRSYFKGSKITPAKGWKNSKNFDLADFRKHLQSVRDAEGLNDKNKWLADAQGYLRYDTSAALCRMCLFIAGHDTIPDTDNPGLMKRGARGSAAMLDLEHWLMGDLETVEHIAPRTRGNNSGWDSSLYNAETRLFDSIGNLTLLPLDLNASASNRGWNEKRLYYLNMAEPDLEKRQALSAEAERKGIILHEDILEQLQGANYNAHLKHLTVLSDDFAWNDDFVRDRGKRILEIVWDTTNAWFG